VDALHAITVESLPRKRVYQTQQLRKLPALALTTPMEAMEKIPLADALPVPMQVPSLQN
jgi:hypothetical protein